MTILVFIAAGIVDAAAFQTPAVEETGAIRGVVTRYLGTTEPLDGAQATPQGRAANPQAIAPDQQRYAGRVRTPRSGCFSRGLLSWVRTERFKIPGCRRSTTA